MVTPDERAFWAMTGSTPLRDEWPPAPGELPTTATVPTLPADMLPAVLRPWLVEVADRACFPLELVAVPALAGAGAVVGRSVGVMPGRYDDFLTVPNIWAAIVARPGMMKSHAIAEGLMPVHRLAATARERFETESLTQEARRVRLESELSGLKSRMGKAPTKGEEDSPDLEGQYISLKREIEASTVHERRYITHDPTVESLDRILIQNPTGVLVLRDELAGWVGTLSKPGREGDREFYLEAWNGTGSFSRDRVGRGSIFIPAVTISLIGGIQPGKLKTLLDDAAAGRRGDDGLIQRLQMMVWPDEFGPWQAAKTWMDPRVRERAYAAFVRLDELGDLMLMAAKVGQDVRLSDKGIPYLRFAPDAQQLFDYWRDRLEQRLRSKELMAFPSFESHIAKYRSLMPSLALLFHLLTPSEVQGPPGPISLDAARMAADWCEFLEQHARKVYAAELSPGVDGARVLVTKVEQGLLKDGDTVRDLSRHQWKGLSTLPAIRDALTVLQAAHWLRVVQMETGGRPTEVVTLHPTLRRAANA